MCVVRQNLEHVRRAEFDEVVALLNEKLLNMSTQKETLPVVEAFVYNSEYAAFATKDANTDAFLRAQVPQCTEGKLICLRIDELTKARKPAIILTGHLQGITAKMEKNKLNSLVNVMREKQGMRGELRIVGSNKTTTGAIIVVKADETALEDLKNNGNLLNVGFAGNILLTRRQQKSEAPP